MRHVCFAAEDDPIRRLTDQLMARTRPIFMRRFDAMAAAVDQPTAEAAAAALMELAASWSPMAAARALSSAMELAAMMGADDVMEEPGTASLSAEGIGQAFQEQIDFLRQKRPALTTAWTDALYGRHDRDFVVAGVTDIQILDEVFTAVKNAADTWDRKAFEEEFKAIRDKYGFFKAEPQKWGAWRIRTIYETNLRTSYSAGRLKQMRDPELLKRRPYWQYRHGENRSPLRPRAQHVAWNGLVLMHDDPWWSTHYPPND